MFRPRLTSPLLAPDWHGGAIGHAQRLRAILFRRRELGTHRIGVERALHLHNAPIPRADVPHALFIGARIASRRRHLRLHFARHDDVVIGRWRGLSRLSLSSSGRRRSLPLRWRRRGGWRLRRRLRRCGRRRRRRRFCLRGRRRARRRPRVPASRFESGASGETHCQGDKRHTSSHCLLLLPCAQAP